MKNNRIITGIALSVALFAPSCTKYLDVVPDNVVKLENVYATKEDAYNGLSKVYSYLPKVWATHHTSWELGDEFVARSDDESVANNVGNVQGIRIMRGLQSVSQPVLPYWNSSQGFSGVGGVPPIYEGIRNCNVFLQYIKTTKYLTDSERADWVAQVKFLKAYFNFILLRSYGPIVISDEIVQPDAEGVDLYKYREKVDFCFDYIINLMKEAIPDLPDVRPALDLGMIDQVIVKGILARVMLYRASPFYSGNREFYEDFLDPRDGQPFFPMDDAATTAKKWQDALDATLLAIDAAEAVGKKLYTFDATKPYFMKDREFAGYAPERIKQLYDVRRIVCEPWNSELIWGQSDIPYTSDGALNNSSLIRLSSSSGITEGEKDLASYSWQWLGASYRMLERYYTKNGLPMEEDVTYNYNGRFDFISTPAADDTMAYMPYVGLLQPNVTTVSMHTDREMRFYGNLDISGGWVRGHYEVVPVMMMQGTSGGWEPSINNGDKFVSGIGIQKLHHPESRSNGWQRQVAFPYPLMRLADLYLMKAEILNEIKATPDQEVWDAINLVRRRASIPDVEVVWHDPALARTVNKHTTKEGMRDIILRERSIELAFEGHRFWDMLRYKKAHTEFSKAIQGWNYKGSEPSTFFVRTVVEQRKFTVRDYLWPISLNEMNTNGNLVQNPGW